MHTKEMSTENNIQRLQIKECKNRKGTCNQKFQYFIENTLEISLCKHCLNRLLNLKVGTKFK